MKVVNPDGKGPRVYCTKCRAWIPARQRPWPKSGYVPVPHVHPQRIGS